jgi:hypothetical protein
MKILNEEDFLIIKNSSNWASKSISKLRLMLDKEFSDEIKSVLIKSYGINKQLKDILDYFVSGSVSENAEDSKTVNDHKAISTFVIVGNNYNNIANQINSIILPTLEKVGIVITNEDIDVIEEQQEDKSKTLSSDKNEKQMLEDLTSILEDLHNVAVGEVDFEKQEEIINNRNNLLKFIEETISILKSEVSQNEKKEVYNEAFKKYNNFLLSYKDSIASLALNNYKSIIKSASSIEETTSYYLLSFAKYTKVITPLKEKILKVKNFIGMAGDDAIYSLRFDCINYTKELINKSNWLVDEIEASIKIKDQKVRWVKIIKALNEFALEYNRYRKSFINMFSIMKVKANQDKLQVKRKKNKDITDPALIDFVEHSWVDMPARVDTRFPKANYIGV